jgi:CRISPR-associated protein Cmr5
MAQTLEQLRAQNAWAVSNGYTNDHVNFAKGLPALIINSGLMQVLAFCHEKGAANEQVASHLRAWLVSRFPRVFTRGDSFDSFMEALMEQALPADYQAIHAEAFAWLKWLRQMAAARNQEN